MSFRDRSIDELELSVRTYICLKKENIQTLGDLVLKTEAELLRTKNFGRKSLHELKEILAGLGLHFGMPDDDNDGAIPVRQPQSPVPNSGNAHAIPCD